MKIRPVGVHLFHSDSRTDGCTERHDEAIVVFRNFVNASVKANFTLERAMKVQRKE